jgi:hypothetical protein
MESVGSSEILVLNYQTKQLHSLVSTSSRLVLGPTQPPILLSNGHRWLFPQGSSGRYVKVTTHLQLVPRSRIRGSIHPLSHMPSCCSASLVKHRDNFTLLVCNAWQSCQICSYLPVLPRLPKDESDTDS